MKTEISFTDPYFLTTKTDQKKEYTITYPVADKDHIQSVINQLKNFSSSYFTQHSFSEIQSKLDQVDNFFCDLQNPEVQDIINLIHQTSGFSRHDIIKFGLGIFPLLINYKFENKGQFIIKALKSSKIIETEQGYLKRLGVLNRLRKWKEPLLLTHFISGNVVGYTAVLTRMGLPIKTAGAAQIIKLPSAPTFFPLIYLKKLESVESANIAPILDYQYQNAVDEKILTHIEDKTSKPFKKRHNKHRRG